MYAPDRLWWYPTSYSRCCEDSINIEVEKEGMKMEYHYYCDICGEELDRDGYPLDESVELP